jgi:hypothetical protein
LPLTARYLKAVGDPREVASATQAAKFLVLLIKDGAPAPVPAQ